MNAFTRLHLIVAMSLASIVGCSSSQIDQPKKMGGNALGGQRAPDAEQAELAKPNVAAPARARTANARAESEAALKVALEPLTPQGDLTPDGVEVSIECFDAKERYLRHKNADAFLDPIVSEQDSVDARFRAIQGLADPIGLSFESFNFPGHYLRNKNGRLTVTKCPDETDRKDATFLVVKGSASERDGWVSFELLTQPDYFVRNRNGEVWAEEKKDDQAYLDSAKFRLVKPVPPQGDAGQ